LLVVASIQHWAYGFERMIAMCKEIESPVFQISLRDRCLYSKTRFYNEERRTRWQHCFFYSASRFLKSDPWGWWNVVSSTAGYIWGLGNHSSSCRFQMRLTLFF
jgi:hypothetical protein